MWWHWAALWWWWSMIMEWGWRIKVEISNTFEMGKISQREPRYFIDFILASALTTFFSMPLLRLVASFPLRKKRKISLPYLMLFFLPSSGGFSAYTHSIQFTEKRWKKREAQRVRQDLCTCWRHFFGIKQTRSFRKRENIHENSYRVLREARLKRLMLWVGETKPFT